MIQGHLLFQSKVKQPEKGDIIVCRVGHLVCECIEDVTPDTVCSPEQFRWFQNKPRLGAAMLCACGQHYDFSYAGTVIGFYVAMDDDHDT